MHGIDAYRKAQTRTEAPRAQEHRRLTELTAALQEATDKPADARLFATAIVENQQFWSRLRLTVMHTNTSLPAEMRAQFVELAAWVEKESARASTGEATLEHLIAVNQQIIEGLRPYQGSLAEGTLEAAS